MPTASLTLFPFSAVNASSSTLLSALAADTRAERCGAPAPM
jgi:hypothetical protein